MVNRSLRVLIIGGFVVISLFAGCTTPTQRANSAEPAGQNTTKPISGETPPELKRPSPSAEAGKPEVEQPVTVASKVLTKAYSDNETAADAKYRRKKLAVVGKITDIETSGQFITVRLEGHARGTSVLCSFLEEHRPRVNMLKEGEIVKLVGTNYGLDFYYIDFQGCKVAPSE